MTGGYDRNGGGSSSQAANPALYIFVIVVCWIAGSWRWLLGKSYVPWDSMDEFFPQVAAIVAALRRGQWPVWNPLVFAGQPVLGDPQGMLFTPHTIAGLVSGPAFGLWVFDVTTMLCVLVGALCLFAYARRNGALDPTAALGAVVYMLAGFATSRLQHVPQIVTYGTLPALLLAFHFAVRHPSVWSAIALGLVAGAIGLNPNHLVFLAPFFLLPVLAYELSRAPRPRAALVALLAAGALAALCAAPLLSAVLDTVSVSTRQVLTMDDSTGASLPGFTLLSIVLPGLFGVLPGSAAQWSPIDPTESYLYVGILPLALLLYGMARPQRPPLLLQLCWLGGLFAVLFAIGTRGPVFPILFQHVPGFNLFRRPSDGMFFFILYCSLAVAMTSAPGSGRRGWPMRIALPACVVIALVALVPDLVSHAAQRGQIAELSREAASFGIRAAAIALVGAALWRFVPVRRRHLILGLAAVAMLTADLTTSGRLDNRFSPTYAFAGNATSLTASMVRVLGRWQRPGNVFVETVHNLEAAGGHAWRTEVVGGELTANYLISLGFPLSQGYNPLRLRRFAEVFGGQHLGTETKGFSTLAPSYDAPPYRWLGLRFVLLHNYILDHYRDFGTIGALSTEIRDRMLAEGARVVSTAGAYTIFEMPHAYPRGSLVKSIDSTDPIAAVACAPRSETTTHLRYRCDSPTAAYLVVGDSYAPGWSACVNGAPAKIEPFLEALRAVAIPPGGADVELSYQPVPVLRRFASCSNLARSTMP